MKETDWSDYNLFGWRAWKKSAPFTKNDCSENRELAAAFEAGFRAGQICGNGLEIAYKEWKHE